MKLDVVHDLQAVYRKLVDSTSRPGLISDLGKEAAMLDGEKTAGCSSSILLLALTLLDPEVTFKVYGSDAAAVENEINQLTFAKAVQADQADYLFLLKDAGEGSLEDAIENANPGTFANPHKSTVIIAETGAITAGDDLLLKGPGIQTSTGISIDLTGNWIERRSEKNKEYPTGVDLVFVDRNHQLLSLPRTTQITESREVEKEWVM
ncbi:phosphonate C-P lyase system protein PhnH [Bacillus sp. CMF12]|uniref:phosphonate C-P lyase system protein PhnH n=1 Tax=Bacillaceae TaxID=186817 RepID=UPI001FB2C549|nr:MULTISPECIES: phosphonate C-P lyase system protein PhnH [Bacillaceae]UOE53689.1 phosphonate C-P lyase system protein PhnH [Cytobacillus oceanisediminis]USK48128.1 phosphonate C-P lyase system protein PhnH [Bacillus sp. CMF12]